MHAHPFLIISIGLGRGDNHKISNVLRHKKIRDKYQLRFDMLGCFHLLITPYQCDCKEFFQGEVHNLSILLHYHAFW